MADDGIRERKSTSDMVRERAYLRDTVPATALLVATQGSLLLLDPDGGASAWTLLWSLLPLVPAGWLVVGQLRGLRRADEFHRVVQLEAMAVGFATVILLSFLGGLLYAAGIGDPAQSLQITFIVGVLSWIGALGVLTWRAR
jgi:hypothetical protein